MAQLMPLRVPQKIQQQQMILSRRQAGTPSHHLAVQAPHLGRPEHHDTVNRRAVPAFRQQHGITEDVVTAGLKIRQHFRPVPALSIDLRGLKSCLV